LTSRAIAAGETASTRSSPNPDVEHVDGAALRIRPLLRNISYRHATARQVVRHWRLAGRPRS
jgi:hypothetical protein